MLSDTAMMYTEVCPEQSGPEEALQLESTCVISFMISNLFIEGPHD